MFDVNNLHFTYVTRGNYVTIFNNYAIITQDIKYLLTKHLINEHINELMNKYCLPYEFSPEMFSNTFYESL